MDYSRFSYGDFICEEAYNAASLNCFAFRHGYDVKEGFSLSLGNMVRGLGFDLQGIHFNNSEWASTGEFWGKNIMGKILMDCRDALRNGSEPLIDYALLREKRINMLGRLVSFETAQVA